jgi:hypothetical protein
MRRRYMGIVLPPSDVKEEINEMPAGQDHAVDPFREETETEKNSPPLPPPNDPPR